MAYATESRQTYVFDVGGTYLRSAEWVAGKGAQHIVKEVSPGFIQYPDATLLQLKNRLLAAIEQRVPQQHDGLSASISLGAAINHHSGEVYAAAPLWGSHQVNIDIVEELHALRPDVHWLVMNDLTAMAIHLSQQPICQSVSKVMLITVSSGIACRIFQTSPFHISFDIAGLQGEIGHLPATGELPALDCDCGENGHIAAYSSGRGVRHVYEKLYQQRFNRPPDLEDFESNFKQKLDKQDAFCQQVLDLAMRPLADLITTALVLDPSIGLVALSGGVTDSIGLHLKRAILARINEKGPYITAQKYPHDIDERLFLCPLNTASGLYGAGIAAEHAQDDWFIRHIPQKGPYHA
ncbi:ROK family protein [Serratia sp. (in: enterobacteria)]|uniref:ROK family protein n=1 Tax=Serratia sp. (in: enterobacteria) TaxID=616 RepID=UPI00398999BD